MIFQKLWYEEASMSKRKSTDDSDQDNVKQRRTSHYFNKNKRLSHDDYNQPCTQLATFLLGKVLCRHSSDNVVMRGRIVEVESYPGHSDGASHSYKGQTQRNRAMFMSPGTSYVYSIYGMYHCFNISSAEPGAAVLIRALEPVDGVEAMRVNRVKKRKNGGDIKKDKDLCNGPSKLCQALDVDKDLNCVDLSESDEVWVERGDDVDDDQRVNTTRVGIDGAGAECARLKLRWYILGNPCVSVRDKQAESVLNCT